MCCAQTAAPWERRGILGPTTRVLQQCVPWACQITRHIGLTRPYTEAGAAELVVLVALVAVCLCGCLFCMRKSGRTLLRNSCKCWWKIEIFGRKMYEKSDKFWEYLVKICQKSTPAGRKGQFGGPGPKKVPKRVDPPAVLGPKIRSNSQKMRKKWYQKIVCFSDRAREGYFSDFWRFLGEKGSEK